MTAPPKRRWSSAAEWTIIGVTLSVITFFSLVFVQEARESADQNRLRIKVRAGRVDPKTAKDILSKQEFEKLDEAWSKRITK